MGSFSKVRLLSLLLFFVTLAIYIATSSRSLMFDDSAEFALVIRLGSIAHSPGFPAYILSGMLWDRLAGFFMSDAILRLNLFSSVLVSGACVLLYLGFRNIVSALGEKAGSWKYELTACFPALVFGLSNTTWMWANTIEVYAFQVFAMGLLLYGLCAYQSAPTFKHVLISAIGLALGWSNHHLTMIVFTVFTPLFFIPGLFYTAQEKSSAKKQKSQRKGWLAEYLEVLLTKPFLQFAGISAGLTLAFYGWMLWKAQQDYPFMFGKPENLDLLFYHIRGGAYTKNITETSGSIVSARLPYFLGLLGRQFLFFLPLMLIGIYQLFRKGANRLAIAILLNFLILLVYQLNNNQWSSTDAYLLLPFMALCIPMVYSTLLLFDRLKLAVVVPALLFTTVALGYENHNRKNYPVSDSLMKLLDESAPKNSVVVLSDWSTVIQYYYYRYMEDFRTDLDVIHYDFKFTHYHLLPLDNPTLYKEIKPEYDRYVEVLKQEHPYQIYNTGCDLSTPELNDVFKALVLKTEQICKQANRTFLTDPRCHYMYSSNGYYEPGRYVSGCFSSASLVDSSYSAAFLRMDMPFLSSPLLMDDPACLDKLVDFQAMLDQHISFYTNNRDTLHLAEAEAAREKILRLQRELKKSMSFAYKIK